MNQRDNAKLIERALAQMGKKNNGVSLHIPTFDDGKKPGWYNGNEYLGKDAQKALEKILG